MAELTLAYEARTYSSGVTGRSICNARHHHWVSENPGGEALGAGEMFCTSMSACAVNMVERIGCTENRALDGDLPPRLVPAVSLDCLLSGE